MNTANSVRLRLLRECGGIETVFRTPGIAEEVLAMQATKRAVPVMPNSPFAKKPTGSSTSGGSSSSTSLPTASVRGLERATLLDFGGKHAEAEEILQSVKAEETDSNESLLFAKEIAKRHRLFEETRNRDPKRVGDGSLNSIPVQKDIPYENAMAKRDVPFVMKSKSVPGFLSSFDELKQFFDADSNLRLPTRSRSLDSELAGARRQEKELPKVSSVLFPEANFVEIGGTQGKPLPTAALHDNQVPWAHLKDDSDRVTFREFLSNESESLVFDFSVWRTSLGRTFAEAVHDFPPLPHVDYLAPAQIRSAPIEGSSFPTLFVNTKPGKGAGTHIDFSETHFWQVVGCGRKKWQLVAKQDLAFLHPIYADELSSPWINDDMIETASRKYGIEIHEVEVGPGEAIFVPAGWAHKVDNVEPTIALSGNFVDKSNLRDVLQQLKIESDCGFEGAKVLYEELRVLDYTEIDKACLENQENKEASISPDQAETWDRLTENINKDLRIKSMTLAEVKAAGGETWTPSERLQFIKRLQKAKYAGGISIFVVVFGGVGVKFSGDNDKDSMFECKFR